MKVIALILSAMLAAGCGNFIGKVGERLSPPPAKDKPIKAPQ